MSYDEMHNESEIHINKMYRRIVYKKNCKKISFNQFYC